MKVLLTEQGNIAYETALCNKCYRNKVNRDYARKMAAQSGDVNPQGKFTDCPKEADADCCICEQIGGPAWVK